MVAKRGLQCRIPHRNPRKKRSVTGCVSSAISQVMYYHKHPKKGLGKKTYKSKRLGRELSVDFSKATYDWNNILPKYNKENYNKAQAKAIAILTYHVGVSVEMEYSSKSS